jgi:arginine:ornithine antiporter/lysine permease
VSSSSDKLKLSALIALVVGSMIGSGIFSLPQNMAVNASAGAIIIGWSITAIGMLCLTLVFQSLATTKPDLHGGIYAYAKAGFGDYLGFSSAWGYWISAWLGNVGYLVLLFSTLGYFYPIFGAGNTVPAMIGASILLWCMHFIILRGSREAAIVNQLVTLAKLLPLLVFILITLFAFKFAIFTSDFWGYNNPAMGSVWSQVRNMMLVTVWVFIGIEGAGIFSSRAQKRSDIGKATVIGFVSVLLLLVFVNVLSMGIMSQPELAHLNNPSMAGVLEHVVGHWGAIFISIALVIALLGSLVSWIMLCAEILFVAAKDHTMPHFLGRMNAKHVPLNALWLTNSMVQCFLIITMISSSTYLSLIYLASSMILVPYFWSAAYALLLALRDEQQAILKIQDIVIATISLLYAIWLLYTGGIKYILLAALLYAPGVILFAKAKRESNQAVFKPYEKLIFIAVLIGALVAAYGLYAGHLTL